MFFSFWTNYSYSPSSHYFFKEFNIQCKCSATQCWWIKQNSVSLDITNFGLGWHSIEGLSCLTDGKEEMTTRSPVTTNYDMDCQLPEVQNTSQWISINCLNSDLYGSMGLSGNRDVYPWMSLWTIQKSPSQNRVYKGSLQT